jgi:serine/threonine-protein kinase RsbW
VGEVVSVEIPARADLLALVRLVVGNVAAYVLELSDERIDDLRLAVSEACANSIEAYGDAPDGTVTVSCEVDDDMVVVSVVDHAGGFDPAALRTAPPPTHPERLEFERGLGIPLIRALVDEAHFDASPAGTTVRLVVRPHADDDKDV